MFTEWGFLLTEIWVLLALAALIGLIAGWLIWGGRGDLGADADEVRRLRSELDRANAQSRGSLDGSSSDIPAMEGGGYMRPAPMPAVTPATVPDPEVPERVPPSTAMPASKPHGLDRPRDGLPDDLTKIKGVGTKMEKLCNALGFWHYDQIAAWSAEEIAWVDDNLEGFKGRVTRDNWVSQAKALARNDTPAFVRRKD